MTSAPWPKQRGILAAVSAEWRGLTDEARTSWRTLASQLPGCLNRQQAYNKINMALAKCGLPGQPLPPSMPTFGLVGCAALLATDAPQVKLLQVSSTLLADRLIIAATPPLSPGLQNVHNRFRTLRIAPGPAPVPSGPGPHGGLHRPVLSAARGATNFRAADGDEQWVSRGTDGGERDGGDARAVRNDRSPAYHSYRLAPPSRRAHPPAQV